jgi:hypothetical protein
LRALSTLEAPVVQIRFDSGSLEISAIIQFLLTDEMVRGIAIGIATSVLGNFVHDFPKASFAAIIARLVPTLGNLAKIDWQGSHNRLASRPIAGANNALLYVNTTLLALILLLIILQIALSGHISW